jgi:hypothetical protein
MKILNLLIWLMLARKKKTEIEDLMLEFHTNPTEELSAEINNKVEDLNPLPNSLEGEEHGIEPKNKELEDPMVAPHDEESVKSFLLKILCSLLFQKKHLVMLSTYLHE